MTTTPLAAPRPYQQPATLDEALAIEYPFAVVPEVTGGYSILFPDLPGCTSFATSLEDVAQQVRDASATWIEATFEMNQPIPAPTIEWDPRPEFPTEPIARLDGQPHPEPEPIYTTERVAGILGVTPGRVRQLAQQFGVGEKVAGVWMYTPADVVTVQGRPGPGRPGRADTRHVETIRAEAS